LYRADEAETRNVVLDQNLAIKLGPEFSPMGRPAGVLDTASANIYPSRRAGSFLTGAVVPGEGGMATTVWLYECGAAELASNLDPVPWGTIEGGQLQLSERVAMQLRELIVSGQIEQGSFLRIETIAKRLGVSPTPVREGLLHLRSEALVKLIPRRGFMVNLFSKQDLLDLFWAQAVIGAELASRAATRMPDQEIERLDELNRVYEIAVKNGDELQTGRLGHEFHRSVNLAADSPRLANTLGALTRQLPNRFYASIEGHLTNAVQFHQIILGSIKLRDPQATASLMSRHINDGGERLVEMLDRRGLWSNSEPEHPKRKKRERVGKSVKQQSSKIAAQHL
jgi:DNA-binding GntR family transcriptional regulator